MYKLTKEEFKLLHNSICELDRLAKLSKLPKIVENIRKSLSGVYAQENEEFDNSFKLFDNIAEKYGLESIWSIYRVSDFTQVPYPDAKFLHYEDFDSFSVTVELKGNTWLDLWKAAENAIILSKDNHHIFIEAFTPRSNDTSILELTTGS